MAEHDVNPDEFRITDPVHKAWIAVLRDRFLESAFGHVNDMVRLGMLQEHAMTVFCHLGMSMASTMGGIAAKDYLGRPPDKERWLKACADTLDHTVKMLYARDAEPENSKGD